VLFNAKKIIYYVLISVSLQFIHTKELRGATASLLLGDMTVLNGYVKDASNDETMVGVTVAILGTTRGGFTNRSGYFSITNIPPGEDVVRG